MVILGEMSYCLYLLHPLVQSFYNPRPGGGGALTSLGVVAYNNAAMLVVLHLLCLGMYRYYEVPARAFLKYLLAPAPPRTTALVPVAGMPGPPPGMRRAA